MMVKHEDWLNDPLMRIGRGTYEYLRPNNLGNEQTNLWQSFHFSTRLKLEAADHFCRQILGAASMPNELGLPLLAHRQLKWYLEAFFFELMSAYQTLLQELNVVYAYDLGLTVENVKWSAIKGKLSETLVNYMEKEWKAGWFEKIRDYRNMAAHHSYLWTPSMTVGFGDKPWDYSQHEVSICRLKKDTGELEEEKVSVCRDLLMKLIGHIHGVWNEMAQQFN